jgi:hypothetical protein
MHVGPLSWSMLSIGWYWCARVSISETQFLFFFFLFQVLSALKRRTPFERYWWTYIIWEWGQAKREKFYFHASLCNLQSATRCLECDSNVENIYNFIDRNRAKVLYFFFFRWFGAKCRLLGITLYIAVAALHSAPNHFQNAVAINFCYTKTLSKIDMKNM